MAHEGRTIDYPRCTDEAVRCVRTSVKIVAVCKRHYLNFIRRSVNRKCAFSAEEIDIKQASATMRADLQVCAAEMLRAAERQKLYYERLISRCAGILDELQNLPEE